MMAEPLKDPKVPNRFVYLLRMQGSTDFKMGIAVDVRARAASLPEQIDLAASLRIECTTLPARKLEQILHAMFHRYRLATHQGDGATEWFDGTCFEKVRDFIAVHCSLLGCSAPEPIPVRPQLLSPAPRVSREEAYRRRLEEWERAKAASLATCNAVIGSCLGLLRAAGARGALKGRGIWRNRYGMREEFIVFDAAPESVAWLECTRSSDPEVRSWVSFCYDAQDGDRVGRCYYNYTLCTVAVCEEDGRGWYVINRPDSKLNAATPLFAELSLLLESIPPLSAYALRKGRAILKNSDVRWDELLSA
jgi:T5orf172 domain-containing protein